MDASILAIHLLMLYVKAEVFETGTCMFVSCGNICLRSLGDSRVRVNHAKVVKLVLEQV